MIFPRLAFSTLGKSTEVKHTVLPDGQPPSVACTMLAHLCSPKANETEMGATLFTKNGEGRNFDFFFIFLEDLKFYLEEDYTLNLLSFSFSLLCLSLLLI